MVLAALPLLLLPPRIMVAFARLWERGIQWLLRNLIGLDYEVQATRERSVRAKAYSDNFRADRGSNWTH